MKGSRLLKSSDTLPFCSTQRIFPGHATESGTKANERHQGVASKLRLTMPYASSQSFYRMEKRDQVSFFGKQNVFITPAHPGPGLQKI
jgi:hypothetical protein